MARAQETDLIFLRNGRVHLNRRGRQFSLLAAEVCASAVVMLYTPSSEIVWRVLATHSIRQFPLHLPCVTVCHHISTGLNSFTLPLTSALDGVGGQRNATADLPVGETRCPLYSVGPSVILDGWRVYRLHPPPGFDPRTVQACSESPYRLSYPGPL